MNKNPFTFWNMDSMRQSENLVCLKKRYNNLSIFGGIEKNH